MLTFCAPDQLFARWPNDRNQDPLRVDTLLRDVSAMLRRAAQLAGVDLDAREAAGDLDPTIAEMVAAAAVHRALGERDPEVADRTTVGPYSWEFSRPDQNLWLRNDELTLLGISTSPRPAGRFGNLERWPG